MDNIQLGYAGEQAVKEILEMRGWKVELGPIGGVDLIVEGQVTVEVKTARLSKRVDNRNAHWQFCIWKDDDEHSPFDEDLLILCCWDEKPCYFVIPGCLVSHHMKKLDITRRKPKLYNGRWSKFREAWELGDYIISGTLYMYQQVPLLRSK